MSALSVIIMLETILVIFIISWIVLFYQVRDIFAPWSITLMVWIVVLIAYLYLDHGLCKTSDDFTPGVMLWCSSFCGLGYIVYRLTPANTEPEWTANRKVVNLFTIVAVMLTPLALYKAATFALEAGTDNLMFAMREQIVEKDSGFSLGPIAYLIHVIYAILLVSADAEKYWNKWFFILCMVINLLFCFVIMSKLVIFIGVISTLYLNYVHKRIKLRTIGMVVGVFIFIGLLFTQIRAASDGDADSTYTLLELLAMYLLSPIPAFGMETACSSPVWGYETFRPFYNFLAGIGMYNGPVFDLDRVFVKVPIPTNVYTTMSPFYNDFGLPGIAVMGAIEGMIVAFIYKKASTGHTVARNLYAYLTAGLALQYYDDEFFLCASSIMQMVILIYICHLKPVWKPDEKFLISSK